MLENKENNWPEEFCLVASTPGLYADDGQKPVTSSLIKN